MARQTVTRLIDDITGKDGEDVETHEFEIPGGIVLTLDLSEVSYDKAKRALDGFTKIFGPAEIIKVPGSVGASKGTRKPSVNGRRDRDQLQAIRDWAATKGLEVAARGRIAASVLEAFEQAHRGATRPASEPTKTISARAGTPAPKKTVRAPRGQQIQGTKAQREDLLRQVQTWAMKFAPDVAKTLTVAMLSEALVDAYSEDSRRDFEAAYQALTKTVAFSNLR